MPALENVKWEAFAQRLAKDEAASTAYMAIYETKSIKIAEAASSRLLSSVKGQAIKARAQEIRAPAIAKITKEIELSQEGVLRELAKIAFSDMRAVAKWNKDGVQVIDSADLEEFAAASIQEVSQGPHGPKIKLHSKHGALVDLGKFMGMTQVDMMTMLLAKLTGVDPHGKPDVDPRDAARRIAQLLRQSQRAPAP